MNGFLAPIAVQRTGDYDKGNRAIWELTRPLFYYSASLQCWLMFPVKFRTNYASVPRAPFVYWYCGDRVYEEAAGHDFIYTVHGVYVVTIDNDTGEITDEPVFRALTKEEGDSLFLEMLLLNPTIPEGMAHTMHKAVSWFGQSSWDADTSVIQDAEILKLKPPESEPSSGEPVRPEDVRVPPKPLNHPNHRPRNNPQDNADENVKERHRPREYPA